MTFPFLFRISDFACRAEVGRRRGLRISFGLRISAFGFLCGLWTLDSGLWTVSAAPTTSLPDDIPPLRPPHDLLPPTFWEQHSTAVIILTIIGLIFLCLCLWLFLRPKSPVIIPPEVQARQALEPLRSQPENGDLLSQVSQILHR